jgi:hypothetical protein
MHQTTDDNRRSVGLDTHFLALKWLICATEATSPGSVASPTAGVSDWRLSNH